MAEVCSLQKFGLFAELLENHASFSGNAAHAHAVYSIGRDFDVIDWFALAIIDALHGRAAEGEIGLEFFWGGVGFQVFCEPRVWDEDVHKFLSVFI